MSDILNRDTRPEAEREADHHGRRRRAHQAGHDRTRPVQSPLRWKGSKRRVAERIIAALPPHICYVEVFGGGASVLLAKPASKVEIYNDVNAELVTFFRVARRHPREMIRCLRLSISAREEFAAQRAARPASLTDIERAVRFFLLNRWSFAGKGEHYGTGVQPGGAFQWFSALRTLATLHRRLRQVVIEQLDFAACLERYDSPTTAFFIDPPYLGTEGYGTEFGREAHERLAALVRALRGRAVITVNDVPAMRQLYRTLPMERFATTLTFPAQRTTGQPMHQLLIRSGR